MVGCVPNVQEVVQMRNEVDLAKSTKNFTKVYEAFEYEKYPKYNWRIEAMRTMYLLDRKFDFAKVNTTRHDLFVQAIRREYSRPWSDQNHDEVKAWALYLLSQQTPKPPLEIYIQAIENYNRSTDPDFRIRLVALEMLYRRSGEIVSGQSQSAKKIRSELLRRLNNIRASIQINGNFGESLEYYRRRRMVENAVDCVRQKLTSYESTVDFLAYYASREIEIEALTDMIKLNFKYLKKIHKTLASPAERKIYNQNISLLCAYANSTETEIRKSARVSLVTFEPLKLSDLLYENLKNNSVISQNDYTQLSQLFVSINPKPNQSKLLKTKTLYRDELIKSFPKMSGVTQSTFLNNLYLGDPASLVTVLVELEDYMFMRDENQVETYLGYAATLRDDSTLTTKQKNALDKIAGAFLKYNSLAVVKEQSSLLLQNNPQIFIDRAGSLLKDNYNMIKTPQAIFLTKTYMYEVKNDRSLWNYAKKRFSNPAAVLKNAFGESDELQMQIARYLSELSPATLIEFLEYYYKDNTDGSIISQKIIVLTGETLKHNKRKFSNRFTQTAMQKLFVPYLNHTDQDVAVFAAKYLLELGYDPAKIKSTNLTVKKMVEMANRAKTQRGAK